MATLTAAVEPEDSSAGWRKWVSYLLLALFLVAAYVAVIANWAKDEVFDTEVFVDTMAPLASDPAVQATVERAIVNELSSTIDGSRVTNLLGIDSSFASNAIAILIEGELTRLTNAFVQSPEFVQLWENGMARLHPALIELLTGEGEGNLTLVDDQVTLDLQPLISELQLRLEARGLDIFRVEADARPPRPIVLFESDELTTAQVVLEALEKFARLIPIVALILLVLYFLVSVDRWRAAVVAAVAAAMTFGWGLLAADGAARWYIETLSGNVNQDTAESFINAMTEQLYNYLQVMTIVAIIAVAITYLLYRHFHSDSPEDQVVDSAAAIEQSTTAWIAQHAFGVIITLLSASAALIAYWDYARWDGWIAIAALLIIAAIVVDWYAREFEYEALTLAPIDPEIEATATTARLLDMADLYGKKLIDDTEFARMKAALPPVPPLPSMAHDLGEVR